MTECAAEWIALLAAQDTSKARRSSPLVEIGSRWTVMPLGRVANDRLRHMLIGYARVCGRLMHQRPVLEVVRETQAHVPERAGVGQQLPRDGFAPIAAQIGNVTTQRIPDERVVTLEGRTVDPATLDTH